MRLAVLFILIAFQSIAQNSHRFADTSALWNISEVYYQQLYPVVTTNEYRVIGDRTFNNIQYQIINCEGYNAYVRQDSSKKVYGYSEAENSEELLFDFNLSVGDTFISYFFTINRVLTVDSVDTVNWGGLKKRIFLSCKVGSCLQSTGEIWVEGVGRLNYSILMPFYPYFTNNTPNTELACYWQNDTQYYASPVIPSCDFDTVYSVSVSEKAFAEITVYPNPATDFILIDTDNYQHQPLNISICSIDGKELFHSAFVANEKISVHHLPAGIYLLRLSNTNGDVSFRKLLIYR